MAPMCHASPYIGSCHMDLSYHGRPMHTWIHHICDASPSLLTITQWVTPSALHQHRCHVGSPEPSESCRHGIHHPTDCAAPPCPRGEDRQQKLEEEGPSEMHTLMCLRMYWVSPRVGKKSRSLAAAAKGSSSAWTRNPEAEV